MKGPCATGYHVPTYAEMGKIGTVLGAANWSGIITHLKIPFTGYRNSNGTVYASGSYGYWWCSSPGGAYGYFVHFTSPAVYFTNSNDRAAGYGIRCLRN